MNINTTNKKKQPERIKYKVDQNGIVYIVKSFYEDVLNKN